MLKALFLASDGGKSAVNPQVNSGRLFTLHDYH